MAQAHFVEYDDDSPYISVTLSRSEARDLVDFLGACGVSTYEEIVGEEPRTGGTCMSIHDAVSDLI